MTKRIDSLTPEQESQMGPWADRWIDFGLCTDPADWDAWEVGARRCYEAAGVDWPGVVVRVQSPLVMCLAGPAAAAGISLVEGRRLAAVDGAVNGSVDAAVDGAVRGAVRDAVGAAVDADVNGAVRAVVDGAVRDAVGGAVFDAVGDAVSGSVGDAVNIAVRAAVDDAVLDAVNGAVDGAVGDAVDGAVLGAVLGAVRDAVRDAVNGAVRDAVNGAVFAAVGDAVGDAVNGAVRGAVGDAVGDAVFDAVGDAVARAVDGAVIGAVDGAVLGAVLGAVRDAVLDDVNGAVRAVVDGAVDGAVGDAVDDAVNGAVRGAVGDAVGGAVDGAVDGAVRDAVGDAVRGAVRGAWWRYLGAGRWWVHGSAWTSYFRDVCGLVLEGDLWDRARAFEQTQQSAWAWWPHRRFVIVCDRPSAIHREQVSPRGWGSHRLHNDSGPAVAFRDGWGVWAIHGVRVTEQIVMRPETLTPADIMAINNAEVRRVAIERFGWPEFVEAAGLILVDECPDPANGDHALRLYNAPDGLLGFDARVLVCTNATPERDGTVRRFGLTVPVEIESALAAAAWTFDETAENYAALEKAS